MKQKIKGLVKKLLPFVVLVLLSSLISCMALEPVMAQELQVNSSGTIVKENKTNIRMECVIYIPIEIDTNKKNIGFISILNVGKIFDSYIEELHKYAWLKGEDYYRKQYFGDIYKRILFQKDYNIRYDKSNQFVLDMLKYIQLYINDEISFDDYKYLLLGRIELWTNGTEKIKELK